MMSQKERNLRAKEKEFGDWCLRAICTVAALQHHGLEIPKLNYMKLVFGAISGDESLTAYLREFVESQVKVMEKIERRT